MARLAIIGGSGSGLLPFDLNTEAAPETAWGRASAATTCWSAGEHELMFLPRHGVDMTIAPHRVNYRANMQLVKQFAADWVVAVNSVGGISAAASPGWLVIPDQLVDYSWGRKHSYYEGESGELEFIDFTEPYSPELRQNLIRAARQIGAEHLDSATYAVTQGPRLETAAEIDRLERDGCHIVGMTAMPEAGLARELDMPYASLSIVVNRAAGRGATALHDEMDQYHAQGMATVARILTELQQIL